MRQDMRKIFILFVSSGEYNIIGSMTVVLYLILNIQVFCD